MNNDDAADKVIRIIVKTLREQGLTELQTNAVVEAATMILMQLYATGAPLTNTYLIMGLGVAGQILRLRKEMDKPPTPPASSSVM